MDQVVAGDRAALGLLYDRHSPRLLGVLVRMLGSKDDAEEVLVDLFAEVWERADRYDIGRGSVATYLLTLARSRAIDRRRKKLSRPDMNASRVRPVEAADATSSAEESPLYGVLLDEQSRELRNALNDLDPVHRHAIELSFFDGLSHAQVAESLSRPLGTVKSWIRQGLMTLRDRLRGTDS